MNLEIFDKFNDPYMQSPTGQGVFLAGILLGYMAERQAGRGGDISKSPLFKQIQFGRMDMVNLKRTLGRVPSLLAAYRDDMKYTGYMSKLLASASERILQSNEEMGVNGNFAFAAGFVNARSYFWEIFPTNKENKPVEDGEEEV